jgi:hypothetical protein
MQVRHGTQWKCCKWYNLPAKYGCESANSGFPKVLEGSLLIHLYGLFATHGLRMGRRLSWHQANHISQKANNDKIKRSVLN